MLLESSLMGFERLSGLLQRGMAFNIYEIFRQFNLRVSFNVCGVHKLHVIPLFPVGVMT